MPKIIRAEFLFYKNTSINSDKVFNVFLIEEEEKGSFSCVTEYGRRGTRLVRQTVCEKTTRGKAETLFWRKVYSKRNHRATPYADDPEGFRRSPFAADNGYASSERGSKTTVDAEQSDGSSRNVLEFPSAAEKSPAKVRKRGIINQGQIDSLEI
jgi:hypothetical protein